MDRLDRELTLELPQNMNLDTFAAHFFNGGPSELSDGSSSNVASVKSSVNQLLNETGRATITSLDNLQQPPNRSDIGNQFFQKIGETLFGLGGGGGGGSSASVGHHSIRVSNSEISPASHNMDILRNHIVIDSADFGTSATTSAASELQQQLEYDKFMNEIWIGIVLTLIIISMVFCICSCFLYHQFRQWKRNYRHNLQQAQDIESVKLNPDADDPVPEYTLVSGLPSYEAALELMQKTTIHNNGNGSSSIGNGSCLIVYPSALFGAFMVNEKESLLMSKAQFQSQEQSTKNTATATAIETATASATEATIPQSPSIGGGAVTATTLLMPTTTPTTTMTSTATIPMTGHVKCQNIPRLALQQYSIPSYEEAIACQPPQQQQQHQYQHLHQHQQQASDISNTMSCVIKSPQPQNWSEDDTTKVLLIDKKKDQK